jgi:hypothetical protein
LAVVVVAAPEPGPQQLRVPVQVLVQVLAWALA